MIRHIVFFSAKDAAQLGVIEQALARLGMIPDVRRFEVARNIKRDGIGNEIDLVVYAEFEDVAALARYKEHAEYARAIQIVRPLRELRFAADIESVE